MGRGTSLCAGGAGQQRGLDTPQQHPGRETLRRGSVQQGRAVLCSTWRMVAVWVAARSQVYSRQASPGEHTVTCPACGEVQCSDVSHLAGVARLELVALRVRVRVQQVAAGVAQQPGRPATPPGLLPGRYRHHRPVPRPGLPRVAEICITGAGGDCCPAVWIHC